MNGHEEHIFAKCKESLEDVAGWKIFIFLPHSFVWRLFIVSTVIFTYVMRTFEFFYGLTFTQYYFVEFVCNVFYFGDTLCASLHTFMFNTRKLRHGKKRNIFLLLIDYISLIPFDMFHRFFIYTENKNIIGVLIETLRINVCLRMYQIFLIFHETRYWIYKMSIYLFIVFVAILMGVALITHLCSCIYFYLLNEEDKRACLKVPLNCVIETELLVFSLLSQSYMEPSYTDPIKSSPFITTSLLLMGYFLTYGLILPSVYFGLYYFLLGYNEFTNRSIQLNVLLTNLTTNKTTRDKIRTYFRTIWTYGKGSKKPDIVAVLPKCLQKSIYCDVHWDAFKHSEFLGTLTLGCKRALSMRMKKDFVLPNTVLLEYTKEKGSFMYLESGILQIMAEENDASPVLTFSGGTVLGEVSLFYRLESKAILKTAKLSVIHYLSHKDFVKVMINFPNDMKKMSQRIRYRMTMARATYERKTKIYPYFIQEKDSSYVEKYNIKWIKQQYRSVWDMQKSMEKDHKPFEKFLQPQKHHVQSLHTQLDHTSVYLSLLVVNDEVINKYDTVCLSIRFPWFLDPDCSFIKVWNKVVLFFTFVTITLYPLFIGWFPQLPHPFFNFTIIGSFVNAVDVFVYLFTAVKDKNTLIAQVGPVFIKKLGSPFFYFDVLAALPLQLLVYMSRRHSQSYLLGLCLLNNFLKTYKAFLFLGEWNYEKVYKPLGRTIFKNMFWLFVSIYWAAMIFKLTGVECIFYECGEKDWYAYFKVEVADGDPRNLASFYLALFLGLDLPHTSFETSLFVSYALYFLSYFLFRLCALLWVAEIVSASVLQRLPTIHYQKLIEVVNYFLQSRRISGQILNRVNDTMRFQWFYDRGNYITQESRLVDDIPLHLRDLLDKHSIQHTLQNCPIFKMEDDDFMKTLCRKSHRMALPANSVLITFGVQTMCLYLVHKGYAQLNSFLPGDIVSNVGKPFSLTTGEIFPIIIAFKQIPSVVTARTVTDCELIVLKMEDILTTALSHQVLRDIVTALQITHLEPFSRARPGLSIVEDVYTVRRMDFTDGSKLSLIRSVLRLLFYRKAINSHSKRYMRWEFFRVFCIFFSMFSWPYVYGCLRPHSTSKWYLVLLLLAVDSTTWIDLYLRTRIAYYNRQGIYISHPIATIVHYLTSSFVVDVLAFAPYFHFIYLLRKGVYDHDLKTTLTHLGLKALNFYRIFGFLNHLKSNLGFSYQVQFLKFLGFGVVALNVYVNVVVLQKVTGGEIGGQTPYVGNTGSVIQYYIDVLMSTVIALIKLNFSPEKITWKEVIFIFCAYFGGKFIEIASYSFLMMSFLGFGKRLSDYQYYLKSFIKFLSGERIEEKYMVEAVDYYEHVWSEMEGINFNSIFSRFPNILHEDILIAVYKSTLRAVTCLSQANEAFYRIVARKVEEVYMEKGSIIIFENQAKADIFFIHKGQCEVKKFMVILCRGSMIGDIRARGLMNHTIVAKTHVVLLKIPSRTFFMEMENFWRTKKAFEEEVSKFNDYVRSSIVEEVEEDAEKILHERKPSEIPEAEYERLIPMPTAPEPDEGDPANKGETEKKARKVRKRDDSKLEARGFLHPASKGFKVLNATFLVSALFTILIVPIFIGMHLFTSYTVVITYVLDIIWIAKIGVTMRTAIINPKTGILSYRKRAIFKKYLYKKNGLIVDILSVLPLELLLCAHEWVTGRKRICITYFYLLRILRFFYIIEFVNKDKQRLSVNSYIRWCVIVVMKLTVINFFACTILLVSHRQDQTQDKCYHEISEGRWNALIFGYMCVVTAYCGTGADKCVAEGSVQVLIDMIIALWGCITKAVVFGQVVVVFIRFKGSKFQMIRQLEEFEKYLVARNISPALLGRAKRYFINLIDYCREEGMPAFLKNAPDFIKFHVMGDLYVHHLSNCRLFRGLDETFLTQLATRLERFVFFPGNYVTMQGDIDHNMYFVHRGEIYCLEKDKEYATLETPVDLYVKNECFGLLQGLFMRYPHSHSYRAKTLAEVLVLNYKDWADMRMVHPKITQAIYEEALRGEKSVGGHQVPLERPPRK